MSEDVELETEIEVGDGEELPDAEGIEESSEAEEESAESAEEDVSHETKAAEQPKQKPKKTFEERQAEMSRKTWEMREAERKFEATAQRAEAAIAKLEAAQAVITNPKPQAENFETQEDFVEALTDWKIDKKEAEKLSKQAPKQEQNQALTDWSLRREKAITKHKDFEQNEIQIERMVRHYKNPTLATLIVESEKGTELVQHFGKNPDLLEKIAKLSPMSAAKEIGKIEDKLNQVPTLSKQTRAVAPVERVGTGGGTPVKDPTKMSYAEFAKARNEKRI